MNKLQMTKMTKEENERRQTPIRGNREVNGDWVNIRVYKDPWNSWGWPESGNGSLYTVYTQGQCPQTGRLVVTASTGPR